MSTSGGVQYIGRYHDACGGYHEYIGSTLGDIMSTSGDIWGSKLIKAFSISIENPMY